MSREGQASGLHWPGLPRTIALCVTSFIIAPGGVQCLSSTLAVTAGCGGACSHKNRIARKVLAYNHKSDAQRNAEIMLRFQGGESTLTLARAFGVSDRRIRAILARERLV